MNQFFAALLGRQPAAETLPEVASLPTATRQTTAELIAEIHHSFNSVGDKLLAEAQATLAGTDAASIAKGARLAAAGFVNTRQVKQTQQQAAKAAEAKAQQALILDYALRYPTSKFITRQHVDQIAAKYNLVVGDTSAYTGFVPDKNLREIEAFNGRFQEADKPDKMYYVQFNDYKGWRNEKYILVQRLNNQYQNGIPASIFKETGAPHVEMDGQYLFAEKYTEVDTSAQLICAPEKDMDLSKLTQQNGHWFKSKQVHIPDPVVLQPVKGGYLIVTAWGDEASDPLVLNEQLN